jgi:hypothetical protein
VLVSRVSFREVTAGNVAVPPVLRPVGKGRSAAFVSLVLPVRAAAIIATGSPLPFAKLAVPIALVVFITFAVT